MQSSIAEAMRAQKGASVRLKKLRAQVMASHASCPVPEEKEEEELKTAFAAAFDELSEQEVIMLKDGMVTLLNEKYGVTAPAPAKKGPSDADSAKKRKRDDEAVAAPSKPAESENDTASNPYEDAIAEALVTASNGPLRLKKLRQTVATALGQAEEAEFKTAFAEALESLREGGYLVEDSGMVTLLKAPSTKRSRTSAAAAASLGGSIELWKDGERAWKDGALDHEYLSTNPDRITRLFCGNLNLNITEEQLRAAIDGIVFIKWMTDKQTRRFYGSTFLEMRDPKAAAQAVMMDKTKLMGRPLKIYYCPPRPGDVWPPVQSDAPKPTSKPVTEMKEKPVGGRKLFIGNLSYEIDDDALVKFFEGCGTMTGLRWLTRKDTGEFRGCGFVEFETSEMADAAIAMNGKELMGRPIRIDWD